MIWVSAGVCATYPHYGRSALKPIAAFWKSKRTLEFKFEPAVETLRKVKSVLDNTYAKVGEIGTLTDGLTKRSHFNDGYYVGPINTNGEFGLDDAYMRAEEVFNIVEEASWD